MPDKAQVKKPTKASFHDKGMRFYTPFVLVAAMLLSPFMRRRPHILVACPMKTGSTWLTNVIAAHDGLEKLRLVPSWGRREQELCEIQLLRYNHRAYVAQHHTRNSEWLQELTRRYNLKKIVLVRNFFDVIVSMRDHVRQETHVFPLAFLQEKHAELSDRALEDFLARFAMPWIIGFYAGWRGEKSALIVRYEDMIADPVPVLRRILEFSGIATNDAKIAAALDGAVGKDNRFNKGVVGRGMELAPETRQMILDQLACYPDLADDALIKEMTAQHQAALAA